MRRVMGHFATGVTDRHRHRRREPVGFACQSFTSVSLEPPLVLFCPAHTLAQLAADPAAPARSASTCSPTTSWSCASASPTSGGDKFAGLAWHDDAWGPSLDGVLATVHCDIEPGARRPATTTSSSGGCASWSPTATAGPLRVLPRPVRADMGLSDRSERERAAELLRDRRGRPRSPYRRWCRPSRASTSSTPTRSSCSTSAAGWRPARRSTATRSGCRRKAMQEMMGVDEPDYGHLLSDMVLHRGRAGPGRPVPAPAGRGRGRLRARRRPARRGLHGRGRAALHRLRRARRSSSSTAASRTGRSGCSTPSPTTPPPAASSSASSGSSPTTSTCAAIDATLEHQRRAGRGRPLRRRARRPDDRGRLAGQQGRVLRRPARGGARRPARLVHPGLRRQARRRRGRRLRRARLCLTSPSS